MNKDQVQFIAVTGGSGSGKTWLVRKLTKELGAKAGSISLDDFYLDLSHLSLKERKKINFDHPDSIDWAYFEKCLKGIREGEKVHLPKYDYKTHTRSNSLRTWKPRPLVLLDGLWLLRRAAMRRLYSLSIYVECPENVRFGRRLSRDQSQRGRSERSIRHQFETQVSPMHRKFVTTQARLAKVRLDSPFSPEKVKALSERCRKLMAQPKL